MHELAVTQGIMDIVLAEAEKHEVKKVTGIKLMVGQLSGVLPQLIQDYFDLLTEDTVAQGAKLIIERVPASIRCETCNEESLIERMRLRCPKCDSIEVKLITGREFYIDSMEVE
jgi:hydrogenase nickel incorporation protein HypA/HybF